MWYLKNISLWAALGFSAALSTYQFPDGIGRLCQVLRAPKGKVPWVVKAMLGASLSDGFRNALGL